MTIGKCIITSKPPYTSLFRHVTREYGRDIPPGPYLITATVVGHLRLAEEIEPLVVDKLVMLDIAARPGESCNSEFIPTSNREAFLLVSFNLKALLLLSYYTEIDAVGTELGILEGPELTTVNVSVLGTELNTANGTFYIATERIVIISVINSVQVP